jgi:hypothetical protein
VAAVQHKFTHKQYTGYRERNLHNNDKKKNGKCGPCPVFASYTLAFALPLRKKREKTSVRVVEKCPEIPIVMKSGSLNLLEPSGPVQACNGIALLIQDQVSVFQWLYIQGRSLPMGQPGQSEQLVAANPPPPS